MIRPTCTQNGPCDGHDCWAQLEWFCEHAGLARVLSGDEQYGDPYCYRLPFVVREVFPTPDSLGRKGLVEYVGVYPVMRICQYRALRTAMREAGWGILSTRVKDGRARTIEICKRRSESR